MLKQLLFSATLLISVAQAQSIKDTRGNAIAINEVTTTLTANPELREPGWQYGFKMDMNVTIGLSEQFKTSYLLQVNDIKPYAQKGYYRQLGYNKPGKYYTCAQLNVPCDNVEVIDIWVRPTWVYNGKEVVGGAVQLSTQKGNFINYHTNISAPGGVPSADVKSGAAKLVKVDIIKWSVRNEDAFSMAAQKLQQAKAK